MVTFRRTEELEGALFEMVSLRGARVREADLRGASMRGVYAVGLEIDTPDLTDGPIVVNGVDVTAYVDGVLDDRFPGRALRTATTPAGLREAWAAVERAWAQARARTATMPLTAVAESVDGEWSFAQTQRHLVLATDAWLRRAILGVEQPFHPLGQPFAGFEEEGFDAAVFTDRVPSYDEVLAVREERQRMVRDFIATLTPELLAEERPNPWEETRRLTVLACLHVILNEEWEHLRYALRDLDALGAPDAGTISG